MSRMEQCRRGYKHLIVIIVAICQEGHLTVRIISSKRPFFFLQRIIPLQCNPDRFCNPIKIGARKKDQRRARNSDLPTNISQAVVDGNVETGVRITNGEEEEKQSQNDADAGAR